MRRTSAKLAVPPHARTYDETSTRWTSRRLDVDATTVRCAATELGGATDAKFPAGEVMAPLGAVPFVRKVAADQVMEPSLHPPAVPTTSSGMSAAGAAASVSSSSAVSALAESGTENWTSAMEVPSCEDVADVETFMVGSGP